jgi:hypothetical protein
VARIDNPTERKERAASRPVSRARRAAGRQTRRHCHADPYVKIVVEWLRSALNRAGQLHYSAKAPTDGSYP